MLIADLLWRAQCRMNRHLFAGRPAPEAPARFVARAGSTDVLEAPELCAVVMTHGRPLACRELLVSLHDSLREAGRERQTFVLVFLDTSDSDYTSVVEALPALFQDRFALYESTQTLGKPGFWFAYQTAFLAVQALRPRLTLFLQDDVTFDRSFVTETLARWDAIEDPEKAVLYLCVLPDDELNGRWVAFRRRDLPRIGVRLTQWFDLQAFVVDRRFFERLRYEIFSVAAGRWQAHPTRSSGVGEQLTLRLFRRANVYQVEKTLVVHGKQPSLMNPEARARRPLSNVHERE